MKKIIIVSAVLSFTLTGLTPAYAQNSTSKKVCELGKPECITFVIQEMERRYKPLAKRCDHDAVFALNYLRTTEVFAQTLDEVDYNDPAAVIRKMRCLPSIIFGHTMLTTRVKAMFLQLGRPHLMQRKTVQFQERVTLL